MAKPNDSRVTIGLAGDVMIGRLVNEQLDYVQPHYIWGDLLPVLKSNDLNLINLEAALTKCTKEVPKVFNFKADPHKVQALLDASIDIVNLANNHVLDYSEEGLLETLTTLDNARIYHVGAGKNLAEARKPVILTKNGIRIGFLGCTDNEPTWKATKKDPGTNFLEVGELEAIQKDVAAIRDKVDVIILSIHWGPNMRERPNRSFIDFAHHLIDSGVDILHGHSAHIFQGVEVYHGKLILYDTGDFVDDYYVDPVLRNDRSFLFMVEVGVKGVVGLRLIPVLIGNFQVNKAHGEDEEWTIQRMLRLSKELHTDLLRNGEELVLSLGDLLS